MVDANYFTVQLSSNASLDTYPTNTLASFRTSLSDALDTSLPFINQIKNHDENPGNLDLNGWRGQS